VDWGRRFSKPGRSLLWLKLILLTPHRSMQCQIKEKECLHSFLSISSAEENFLRQKSRVQWLNLGNNNSGYFHKTVKVRNSFNLLKSIKDDAGNVVNDMQGIKRVVTGFY
jgi:hypothetical protein